VKSVRGPGGGYVLSRSMDEISIKDVLECVGENINPARDILGIPSSGIEILKDESGNLLPYLVQFSDLFMITIAMVILLYLGIILSKVKKEEFGKFVIFDPMLDHEVLKYHYKKERVVAAFNCDDGKYLPNPKTTKILK
jgi:hypothetical protein